MKAILTIVLKLGVLTLLFYIINVAASLLLRLDRFQTPAEPANTAMMTLLVCFLNVIAISYPVIKSKWGGWGLVGVVFLLIFGIRTFLTQIETLVFLNYLVEIVPEEMVPLLFLEGMIVAVVFAPLAVFILGKFKNETDVVEPVMVMPWKAWVKKLLLLGIIYVAIYILFGMFVFRPLAGEAFDTYYVNLQMPPWIIPFQVLRGIVWAVLAFPVIKMMRGAFWEKGLAVALLFAILMGSLLLIPNGIMPDEIRLSHFVEVITSNFLFGWIVVWVLYK